MPLPQGAWSGVLHLGVHRREQPEDEEEKGDEDEGYSE